jgi:hypothetical protein
MNTSLSARLLGLVVIFLLIIIAVMTHTILANKPSYAVGAPVTPSSMLPAGMTLKTYDVASTTSAPTVGFTIRQDSMGGWDVHATTTNFAISPEHLNGAAMPGEGHLHLYIDDNLIIMLGDWYHIDSLAPGTHVVRVGLFNNDHSAYAIDGRQIQAEQTVSVPARQPSDGSMPADTASGAANMPGMAM